MSGSGEPPSKVVKFEMREEYLEGEGEGDAGMMDEGQEEWLSEEVLTDDDYAVTAADQSQANTTQDTTQNESENIEQTLTKLESSQEAEVGEELDAFLVRKVDTKSEDDGNDTDDLLRMLGDDNSKKKHFSKTTSDRHSKSREEHSSDDDDEYIFEGAKVTRLKVAKNAVIRKYPSKAEPEDMDDTDLSSDEADTMKKMFGVKNKSANVAAKSTAKSSVTIQQKPIKQIVQVTDKPKPHPKSQLKPNILRSEPKRRPPLENTHKHESEEIIDEAEFLDEEQFDLDEEFADEEEEPVGDKQRIMRPEQMDEEIPTDGESHSEEEDSMYDELPSSDSEDMEDWFSLDIRNERAGDYIPLLGSKAHELLIEEKRRVWSRVVSLRESLRALSDSAAQHNQQLAAATLQLAQLDDMLKAA